MNGVFKPKGRAWAMIRETPDPWTFLGPDGAFVLGDKAIKDHYTDAAAKSYFLDREGQAMSLPTKFLPAQALLEKHRALLAG